MPEPTLEFLSRQLERVLDRLSSIEDQITILTGMSIRHDGSLSGLAVEVRGLVQSVARIDHRLRKIEEAENAQP